MGVEIKKITVEQVWKAIEHNGVEIIREAFFDEDGNGNAACLLGVAAINLGVVAEVDSNQYLHGGRYNVDEGRDDSDWEEYDAKIGNVQKHSLHTQLSQIKTGNGNNLASDIISMFDKRIDVYDEIDVLVAKARIEKGIEEDSDEHINLYDEVAENFWNTLDKSRIISDGSEHIYELTYDEALVRAHEILAPFFDRELELAVEDYIWKPKAA